MTSSFVGGLPWSHFWMIREISKSSSCTVKYWLGELFSGLVFNLVVLWMFSCNVVVGIPNFVAINRSGNRGCFLANATAAAFFTAGFARENVIEFLSSSLLWFSNVIVEDLSCRVCSDNDFLDSIPQIDWGEKFTVNHWKWIKFRRKFVKITSNQMEYLTKLQNDSENIFLRYRTVCCCGCFGVRFRNPLFGSETTC